MTVPMTYAAIHREIAQRMQIAPELTLEEHNAVFNAAYEASIDMSLTRYATRMLRNPTQYRRNAVTYALRQAYRKGLWGITKAAKLKRQRGLNVPRLIRTYQQKACGFAIANLVTRQSKDDFKELYAIVLTALRA